MKTYADILRDHPILSCLSNRALTRLKTDGHESLYHKGDVIVREGDRCTSVFVVISGRCEARAQLPDGSQGGKRTLVQGDTFGERVLLGQERFWFTVTVLSDCEILDVPVDELQKQLLRNPQLRTALERQMFSELRAMTREHEPNDQGRIAVFAGLAGQPQAEVLTHRIATIIRQDTGRSVLYVHLKASDQTSLQLSHWQSFKAGSDVSEFDGRMVKKETSGVWRLDLGVRPDGSDASNLAPLLGYVSRHARFVVMYIDAVIDSAVVAEALVQSDLPYVLMSQTSEDLYRCNLLVRLVGQHRGGKHTTLRPVICLSENQRAESFTSLEQRLGVRVHEFIHSLQGHMNGSAAMTHVQGQERVFRQLRYLAREIGRCRIGLALSAGGAKGLAHIGVIQVLEEQGIEIDMIAGTSIGAMIGALWAYGLSGQEMQEVAMRNKSLSGMMRLFDPVFPPRRGFIKGRIIPGIISREMGDAQFADLKRQLRVVTTDLDTLERVVISSGGVASAVHASMAMPGVVVPVTRNGRTLVDGGVAEPIPVGVLQERHVEHVIAVNTIPTPEQIQTFRLIKSEHRQSKRRSHFGSCLNHYANCFSKGNILDVWVKSMHGMETRLAESACRHADVVLRPTSCDGRWHDFVHPEKYIALGRRAAESQLERIKESAA